MKPDTFTNDVMELFDRWYQHVRRSIWVGDAQYALQQHGVNHDEATKEAKQLYEDLRYHCWRRHEERKTDED